MHKIIWFVAILSFFINSVRSQENKNLNNEKKETDAVFITYERTDKIVDALQHKMIIGSVDSKEDRRTQGVVLRLQNHTKWAIKLPTHSLYIGNTVSPIVLKNGTTVLGLHNDLEVNVRYKVETFNNSKSAKYNTKNTNNTDVYSDSWLPSGQSIIFGVNQEHLQKNSKIYVPFNYEWQTGEESQMKQHRVYFDKKGLPLDGILLNKNEGDN